MNKNIIKQENAEIIAAYNGARRLFAARNAAIKAGNFGEAFRYHFSGFAEYVRAGAYAEYVPADNAAEREQAENGARGEFKKYEYNVYNNGRAVWLDYSREDSNGEPIYIIMEGKQ